MKTKFASLVVLASFLLPGATAATIYTNDFGSDNGSFVVTNIGIPPAQGFVYSPGVWNATGGGGVSYYSKLSSPTITLPTAGTVTLSFMHRYNFEFDWDGAAVYISVNGGTPTYVPASAFSSNGYVQPLESGTYPDGIFTGGESVFTGQSTGWGTPVFIESIASIATLNANDTVSIEFRGGWDWATVDGAPNWEISSVTIAVVPEPTALAAGLLGIVLLSLRRRRV